MLSVWLTLRNVEKEGIDTDGTKEFMDKTLRTICAFMLEDGIQAYFQFTLYEATLICSWERNGTDYIRDDEFECNKIRSHDVLSSNGKGTVAFSSTATLVGSIYKLFTIVLSLRFWCNVGVTLVNFTKNKIIITLMFIGTFSHCVMNVSRIVNIYFIYGEHETFEMYFHIVHCMWLTFVSYSVTLVVYFTFDTKDKFFRILNLIGVFIWSNVLALFIHMNVWLMVHDGSSFMDEIIFAITFVGL